MLFPVLREWSILALLVSLIPLIGGILLARRLFFSSRSLWLTLLFLIPLGLCIWSAVAVINAYSLDLHLSSSGPRHGLTQYIMWVENTSAYTRTIFISQIQIAIALIILLALLITWFLAKRATREPVSGEVRRLMRQRLL